MGPRVPAPDGTLRRRTRIPALAGLAVLLLAGGCGRERTATAPGLHSIHGHVVLIGQLVNGGGGFAGTRVVGDADGVQVELLYGSQVIARTTTTDGVYTFPNLAAGGYVARSYVLGSIGDKTVPLTIVDSDVYAADTLRVASAGDLYPVPNPFGAETFVYFQLPDTEEVLIRIMGMAGQTVDTLLFATRPDGPNQVRWDGTDRNGNQVTGPIYWITLVAPPPAVDAPPDYRAQLLFR